MCYTADTSLYTFIIGAMTSLVLIGQTRPDYQIVGGFFFVVSLMQLYDYIFWTHLPPSELNRQVTRLACLTNYIQPFVLALLIYRIKKQISPVAIAFLMAYALVIITYLYVSWNKLEYTEVTEKSNGSLEWSWNHQKGYEWVAFFFVSTLAILFWKHLQSPLHLYLSIAIVASFFFSMYKYKIRPIVGRFWCYFAAWVPAVIIVLDKLMR